MMRKILRKTWLPYAVGAIGIILSFIVWFLLYLDLRTPYTEAYHPWLGLALSLTITFLVTAIIRSTQLARAHAHSLKKMNKDLKKEITERIAAEETKLKLESALMQGQKLQAIGTLAGGIAHDFNNILYAIIGYVEMAREDVEVGTAIYKNLGKVLDGAHRGQELIARILAFSRRQHHQHDVINLKTTIEAALALLRPTIPASVSIEFSPTVDVRILGNQTQIHQVLVNIINNAVDAMEGEGEIHISMAKISSNDPFLKQFPQVKIQNYCKIEITDSGHGMDQSTIERIFEPFFTTKEVGKGTGLGLSIVHTIIKDHDGEIHVSSTLGKGTKFMILLPEYNG